MEYNSFFLAENPDWTLAAKLLEKLGLHFEGMIIEHAIQRKHKFVVLNLKHKHVKEAILWVKLHLSLLPCFCTNKRWAITVQCSR